MSSPLAPKQVLILWYLIGRGGAAWRSEIRPEPSGKDRKALEKAKLTASEKRGRSIWIEVTDAGWAWANDHLASSLPARTQSAGPILQAWLTHLQAFLRQRGLALGDIISARAEPISASAPSTSRIPLEDRIRKVYLEATGGVWNQRVRLSDLRSRLGDVAKDALDAALLKMQQASKLVLFRLDNQREITDADRKAALHVGDEPRHVLHMAG
jgi:hypothetical protein